MTNMKPQTLKGFRDFLPNQMAVRQKVIDICRETFELFGFKQLETPSLEYASTLLEKYGEEADKLVYTFKDKGNRDVGLIYDLTVPTAKVLSMYQNKIKLPFKRYQIQKVWRADKPQKARYREFTQCDVDIFGVRSYFADAEIIALIYKLLNKLNFKSFTIKINSRKILFDILDKAGFKDKKQQFSILQTIDKLDKKSKEEVIEELENKKVTTEGIKKLFDLLENIDYKNDENILRIVNEAEKMGVVRNLKFVPYMVRGLNYYTGTIFETTLDDLNIGSITAGGRYDNLISMLGGPDTPAVGTTFGLDRICDAVTELKLLDFNTAITQVLVTIFPGYENYSLKLTEQIRDAGIKCELYLEEKYLDKQFKYADKNAIPYVVIIGPEEVKNGIVKLKDMKTGEQEELKIEDLIKKLKT